MKQSKSKKNQRLLERNTQENRQKQLIESVTNNIHKFLLCAHFLIYDFMQTHEFLHEFAITDKYVLF